MDRLLEKSCSEKFYKTAIPIYRFFNLVSNALNDLKNFEKIKLKNCFYF